MAIPNEPDFQPRPWPTMYTDPEPTPAEEALFEQHFDDRDEVSDAHFDGFDGGDDGAYGDAGPCADANECLGMSLGTGSY